MKPFITLCAVLTMMLAGSAAMGDIGIDGTVAPGEWDAATPIAVSGGKGTVSVYADPSYLFVLFNVSDSTDDRLGQNLHGNDQISINVNPTEGGSWGFPYDLIFETSSGLPWNPKVNSGTVDGWNSRWFPNNAQQALPAGLQSATVYAGGSRTTEWRLPLASSPGDVLLVGGAVDVGDGSSYVYPVGNAWSPSTFTSVTVVPAPGAALLGAMGLAMAGWIKRRFSCRSEGAK
jgi:hypothetical protein